MDTHFYPKNIYPTLLFFLLFIGISCSSPKQNTMDSIQSYFQDHHIGEDKDLTITSIDTCIYIGDSASYNLWEFRIKTHFDDIVNGIISDNDILCWRTLLQYRTYCSGIKNPKANQVRFVVNADTTYNSLKKKALDSPDISAMGKYIAYKVTCSSIDGSSTYFALCSNEKTFLVSKDLEPALFKILFQDSDYKQYIQWSKAFPKNYEAALKELNNVCKQPLF